MECLVRRRKFNIYYNLQKKYNEIITSYSKLHVRRKFTINRKDDVVYSFTQNVKKVH